LITTPEAVRKLKHTPSKQDGAAKSPGSDDQDRDEAEEPEEDDAGGDPDATRDLSYRCNEGLEGTI